MQEPAAGRRGWAGTSFDVQADTGTVRVFTWLNLYAGGLRTDDEIEVFGRWVFMHGHRFLLVAGSDHAIRVLCRTSTNPV